MLFMSLLRRTWVYECEISPVAQAPSCRAGGGSEREHFNWRSTKFLASPTVREWPDHPSTSALAMRFKSGVTKLIDESTADHV